MSLPVALQHSSASPSVSQDNDSQHFLRYWWRNYRIGVVITALVLVFAVVAVLAQFFAPNRTPYSVSNYRENGSAALANIASSHDVNVTEVSQAKQAIDLAHTTSATVVIVLPENLNSKVRSVVEELSNPVVFLTKNGFSGEFSGSRLTAIAAEVPITAEGCTVGVSRAGSISPALFGATVPPNAEGCFFVDGTAQWVHVPASPTHGDRYIVANASIALNSNLDAYGNASLLLSTISAHGNDVIWWIANDDALTDPVPVMPPYLKQALILLVAIFLVAALVQGRRFGPLVPEKLPVVVPALETTHGRGSLYQHSRDVNHAATIAKAWSIRRMAHRVGVGSTASPAEVVDAISHATGRPAAEIDSILYHTHPQTGRELVDLFDTLKQLESEVTQ